MPGYVDTLLRQECIPVVLDRFQALYKKSKCATESDFFEKLAVTKGNYYKLVRNGLAVRFDTAKAILVALQFVESEINDMLETTANPAPKPSHPMAWNPPRTPNPFLGRTKDLETIKAVLGLNPLVSGSQSKIISVHGVPGVGKSTFSAWLANDPDILRAFPDAVLWTAFGQFNSAVDSDYEIRDRLKSWGALLGDEHLQPSMSQNEMASRLANMLKNRRALLICDDVWDIDDVIAVRRLADGDVRVLVTSRLTDVAQSVVSYPDGIVEMKGFEEEDSISLLRIIAPFVVAAFPNEMVALANDLENLPLAISIAGHLLRREMSAGLNLANLIDELRDEGGHLLSADLTADMQELVREARSPTIAAWLKRSTRMLDVGTRQCFISLGYLAPKPATFELDLLNMRWEGQFDVNAVIRKLVDVGLIQATSDGLYQMHALLVTLAKSMRKESANE